MTWVLRLVTALVAWESSVLGYMFWQLRHEEAFVPYLWPALFGMGAFGAWVLAIRPCYRWALITSIVGLVCGHMGRSLAVFVNWSAGTVAIADERVWVGSSLYGLVAVLIAFVWLMLLVPIVEANRARRR